MLVSFAIGLRSVQLFINVFIIIQGGIQALQALSNNFEHSFPGLNSNPRNPLKVCIVDLFSLFRDLTKKQKFLRRRLHSTTFNNNKKGIFLLDLVKVRSDFQNFSFFFSRYRIIHQTFLMIDFGIQHITTMITTTCINKTKVL